MSKFKKEWIPDKDHYDEQMKQLVESVLDPVKESGYITNAGGRELYYEMYRPEKPIGKIVIVHGFTEILPKYYEAAVYFIRGGYAVYMLQQIGHGKSYRYMENKDAVHIPDWREMVDSLALFIDEKVVADERGAGLPVYLFGHSMGGGLSACYLEKHPEVVTRAVLSSPMLEVDAAFLTTRQQILASRLMVRSGRGSEPSLGAQPFEESDDFDSSASQGEARYRFQREIKESDPMYQGNYATWQTAYNFAFLCWYATRPWNVRKIKAQILLFSAENDTLVRRRGQDRFMRRLRKKGKMIIAPNCKHEIFTSDDPKFLTTYWKKIFKFLKFGG